MTELLRTTTIAAALLASTSAWAGDINSFGGHMDVARDKAMRECMGSSKGYSQATWGNMEIQVYRACMAARGQVE
jgi:hypothetical protein